ncbi:MAG: phospholipase [Armatimonadetes bacterium]|nr:phospholipase [Armatimonadota bacterium]
MARDSQEAREGHAAGQGRLRARPSPTLAADWDGRPGEATALDLTGGYAGGRDALLYVPRGYRSDRPAPLALMLHGAGGNASHGLGLLADHADAHGLLLLAPASRRQTWDAVLGRFGPDVSLIERALAHVFGHLTVDPGRVAIGGFSDGASYALSLGITNGDLFGHILALSPGFTAHAARRGRPRIFVSHGTRDETLPIAVCSRRVVPALRHAGYDVDYREFEGPHTVPPQVVREAVSWFLPPMA